MNTLKNILFFCCLLCLSIFQMNAQGTCASATDLGALDPCLPNQTFNVTNTNDGGNVGGCNFDGNEAFWVSFTLPVGATGITIDIADWGGCSGTLCQTDVTGNLYASTDGTCNTLAAVDDCIDFTSGTFNGTNNGPFMYNSLAPGTYYLRISEEDDQGGFVELQIHANPLPGDSPTNPVDLATANGNYCNFTAGGNDCAAATTTGTCIGTIDNSIFYSFTVDATTPQPVTFGLENVICDGNLQMAIMTPNCGANLGTGSSICSVSTGSPAPQLSVTLPLGDYLLLTDGVAGDDCSWTLTSSIIDNAVSGCTDPCFANYDATATIDDGSCMTNMCGCTDPCFANYDAAATMDDGSCTTNICGCTDPCFANYDAAATMDDGSCMTDVCGGCTDPCFTEYDPTATTNDGSCVTAVAMTNCNDNNPCTINDMEVLGVDGSICQVCAGTPTNPPIPSLTCPPAIVNLCDGSYDCMFSDINGTTSGNGVTDAPIVTGSAAAATSAAGVIDLTQLQIGGTYTLTLNYEENGCLGTPVTCTFTVSVPNDAEGGQFDEE